MSEVENNIIDDMLSEEELLDLVMGVTPMGAAGSIRNIFKLGWKGLKEARTFIELFSAVNQRNPEVLKFIKELSKKHNLSVTTLKDMAKKRSALESQKHKGKYYPRSDRYTYEE